MLSSWDLLILLSRLGLYMAVAGSVGASFALVAFHHQAASRRRLLNYFHWSATLGLLAVALNFISRSAAMSGGFASAFDEIFLSILWQSGAGNSSRWQISGFFAALLGSLLLRRTGLRWIAVTLVSGGLLALLWSFTFVGHFATQAWYNKLILALHVLAMALWLGSFYPLLTLSGEEGAEDNLRRFSFLASGIVALLVTCGVWMSLVLLHSVTHLFSSNYGRVLLAKLAFVFLLLSLAALNKWILVLDYARRPQAIRRSIQGEILVGLCILIITSVLANLVSPH